MFDTSVCALIGGLPTFAILSHFSGTQMLTSSSPASRMLLWLSREDYIVMVTLWHFQLPQVIILILRFPNKELMHLNHSATKLSHIKFCGICLYFLVSCACTDSERFVRGVQLWCCFFICFFLVDEGREDLSTTISGPSSAFRWCADDSPTLNAGLVAVIFQGIQTCIARKPYILVIFQGGGGGPDPLSPALYPQMMWNINEKHMQTNSPCVCFLPQVVYWLPGWISPDHHMKGSVSEIQLWWFFIKLF